MPNDDLTTKARIGIGVGVGTGVLLVGFVLIWVFVDPIGRLRHRRNADRIEAASRAQGRGKSPEQPEPLPTPPSLHEIHLDSPTTADSVNLELHSRPTTMQPFSYKQDLNQDSSCRVGPGCQLEHWDTAGPQRRGGIAPAPVVGGMGVHKGGVAHGRPRKSSYGSSPSTTLAISAINNHGILDRTGSSKQSFHIRPASAEEPDPHAIWTNRPLDARHDRHVSTSVGKGRTTAGQSITSMDAVERAGSRSHRIVTSPIVIAGERYQMALEL